MQFYGPSLGEVILKKAPEDFFVEEYLDVEFSGDGEHLWLWVQKRDTNTDWVAKRLPDLFAALKAIPERDVSYSGRKDRFAVTKQWFSLRIPGLSNFSDDEIRACLQSESAEAQKAEWQVLDFARHNKKLRTGTHQANAFDITVYFEQGDIDKEAVEQRLKSIEELGLVNCFGEQRFGRAGQNLQNAIAWVKGERKVKRHQKSMLLSALRSAIFNSYCEQVAKDEPEFMQQGLLKPAFYCFANGRSQFLVEQAGEAAERMAAGEILPLGPMYGSYKPDDKGGLSEAELFYLELALEQFDDISALLPDFCRQQRLDLGRRAMLVRLEGLSWAYLNEGQALQLRFTLPTGSFATQFLSQLFVVNEPARSA